MRKVQKINVLIAGKGTSVPNVIASKYLNKLYVTSEDEIDGAILIKFNTFKELAQKCKALQIDIVLVEEEKWILQGIADVLKSNFVNCIAPTSKWTFLNLSKRDAKKICIKHDIKVPKDIKLPVDFPIMLKTDGFTQKTNSLDELIKIRQDINTTAPHLAENLYLEEFIDGDNLVVTSLFDGKHIITFNSGKIDSDRLHLYSKQLEMFLANEKADFTGFFNSRLIKSGKDLYNIGFDFTYQLPVYEGDFLFLLISAVYQKLDEVKFLQN